MDFPYTLTNDEFTLRCKEWAVAGLEVLDRNVDFLIGERRRERKGGLIFGGWLKCVCYERDGLGDWKCTYKKEHNGPPYYGAW